MEQAFFNCDITGYFIEYILSDNTAYMNTVHCDYINIKPFIQLMRVSIEKLKERNINKIRQTVSIEEWKTCIKNTTFQKITEDTALEICDIECDIDDFLENFGIILRLEN